MRVSEEEFPETCASPALSFRAATRGGMLEGEENHERSDRTEIWLSKS